MVCYEKELKSSVRFLVCDGKELFLRRRRRATLLGVAGSTAQMLFSKAIIDMPTRENKHDSEKY